jgi:two-component system response regulator HydG
MDTKILVVDDDRSHRRMLDVVLSEEGYEVHQADDGAVAVDLIEKQFYDVVLMDIRMKNMDGIEAQRRINEISPSIIVIMMTAYASVNTAVEALKSGAYDYLTKPIDIEELNIHLKKALDHNRLEKENLYLREQLKLRFDFSKIIGQSDAMRALFETVSLVAPTDATVLISGESGTGKELIANAIHQNSSRKSQPFIKINCAALPETLLESELFGHKKGAFTGATTPRKGRFFAANKGSILLDEIAEMTPTTQAKILRVLQEQEFEPVGSTKSVRIDTRIMAATNKDLEQKIEAGQFRKDLFYRLNVVQLEVPPLRKRRDDIPLLADFFTKRYAEKNHKLIKRINPVALDFLMRYAWPGNVRELENIIERAVILSRDNVISPEDLPSTINLKEENKTALNISLDTGKTLKDIEKSMIIKTLEENNGNRTRTAQILDISRRTLQIKLKQYGINV